MLWEINSRAPMAGAVVGLFYCILLKIFRIFLSFMMINVSKNSICGLK